MSRIFSMGWGMMAFWRKGYRRSVKSAAWGGAMAACLLGPAAEAQTIGRGGNASELFVGSELEAYLRLLQLGGLARPHPWSIRSFSPNEVERLVGSDSLAHPWKSRYELGANPAARAPLSLIEPRARAVYNSAFAYGYNDGPVWAGRGLTTAVEMGFAARLGPASLVVAPTLFRSENRDFEIAANGRSGPTSYGDAEDPYFIDLPQRFGDGAYSRLDPGQSTLRLDLPIVTLGVSTANQAWGPASEHPILVGPNAAGYLHGFVGSSTPWNLWVGRAHGRLVWGRLNQSEFSDVQGVQSHRFMSGIIGVFTPRGAPGLEIGVARFFHTPWPADGLTVNNFAKPLESILKAYLPSRISPDTTTIPDQQKSDADNQLASVFARWVLPGSGFELYGEFGRDDHNYNLRDFITQTDHSSAYSLGFRKLWRGSDREWTVLRGEVLNAQPSHLLRVRAEYAFYIHGGARQGHTQVGQTIGSYAAHGGGGSILAYDRYSDRGRTTFEWRRVQRREQRAHLRPLQGAFEEIDAVDADAVDVLHGFGVEGTRFLRGLELSGGAQVVYNLNRDFAEDAVNLNLTLGVNLRPR